MNEIIYLETDEEITSVIDKLRGSNHDSVALVVPRGATLAQSIVNLKLLKKSAKELGKDIALVATDRIARNLGSQIGLTVYSKVSEAERGIKKFAPDPVEKKDEGGDIEKDFQVNNYYHNKVDETVPEKGETADVKNENNESGKIFTPKVDRAEPIMKRRQLEERKPIIHKPVPQKTGVKGSRKLLFILGGAALVVILAATVIFLPYAKVSIKVTANDLESTKEILVDKSISGIDLDNSTIAGKIEQIEKDISKDFDATGKKDAGAKASGTLQFSNRAGIEDQIAAGVVVKSSGGVDFVTDQAISLPKATASVDAFGVSQITPGKADGKVTARNTGTEGNLPPTTTFTVTSKPLISAAGETAGGITKDIKIVSDSDLESAANALKDEAMANSKSELIDLAKLDKVVIEEKNISAEVVSVQSSKNVNEEADKFSYSMKLKITVLGYYQTDLDGILVSLAENDLEGDEMVIAPEKATKTITSKEYDINVGTMKLDTVFEGKSGNKISEDEIKGKIKGKTLSQGENEIKNYQGVTEAKISNFPNFYKLLPILKSRIKIEFTYE